MKTLQRQSGKGVPSRNRGGLSVAGAALLVLLSGCVSETEMDTPVAPDAAESTDAPEEVFVEQPEPAIETVRDVPPSCDLAIMTEEGWFELPKTNDLDPTRFHDWLSRPDLSNPDQDPLRCVYGGEFIHDILVVEFQPLSNSAAAAHQEQLIAASYQEAAMSTPEAPMFFRARVSLDDGPMVLRSDIPGFEQEMCWDLVNVCVSEAVIYGQGMWATVAWAAAAWEGDTEWNTLRALQNFVSEG